MPRIFYIVFICLINFALIHSTTTEQSAPKRMKILVVTSVFPKLSEPFILDQVKGLLERGQDVFIYAKSGDFEKMHPEVEKYNLLARTFHGELPADIASYDIILCQFGQRGNEIMKIKKERQLKAKLVTYFRGADITEYVKKHPHCYEELFTYGDFFLTNCDFFRNRAISLGCDPKKILVHYSAIDCERFAYQPRSFKDNDPIRIATTGRLVEKKGIDFALYAISDLVKKQYPIEYHIIGEGYFKDRLERLVAELDLKKHVTFFTSYNQEELIAHLSQAHIFLLPSVTAKNTNADAIPNVLKEAMAIGVPVISTIHGGIPEMLQDGKNGLLVPEKDSKALAEKLEYLINNKKLWRTLGDAGRKTVANYFDTAKQNDRLVAILKIICQNQNPTYADFAAQGICSLMY